MNSHFTETKPHIPWIDSLLLHERKAILGILTARSTGRDHEKASNRLLRWRSQTPFRSDSSFHMRLQTDGLNEEHLAWILADIPPTAHQDSSLNAPDWPNALLQIYGRVGQNRKAGERLKFDTFVMPLVDWVDSIITIQLDTISSPAFDEEGRQVFRLAVRRQVRRETLDLSYRVLVLELNIARVTEKLKGVDATERFCEFCQWLNTEEGAVQILQEYPVLSRRLMTRVSNLADAALNLAINLGRDYASVCNGLCASVELGPLRELKLGLGDSHNGARSVAILSFQRSVSVVYKPRSGAVDVQFLRLANWLNDIADGPKLRVVKVLDHIDHAWYEHVEPQSCGSTEAISRYYHRVGILLALMYCIEATDIHFENLVASGEYPLVVDMETIFQPRQPFAVHREGVLAFMQGILEKSVMRVGLLPQPIWARDGKPGVDISGIGTPGGQILSVDMAKVEDPNTDNLRIILGRGEFPTGMNRPSGAESGSGAGDYQRDILDGFTSAYRAIAGHRVRLSAILDEAVSTPVRALLRPSMVYSRVLDLASHPDALRCGRELSFVLDRLWVGATLFPQLSLAILDERRQLMAGDIPHFNTLAGSRDLVSQNGTIASAFFPASGIEEAKEKVGGLSPGDLQKQVWIITATITAASPHKRLPWSSLKYGDCAATGSVNLDLFLSEAVEIAEHLIATSESNDNWIGWRTLRESREGQWSLSTTGFDLYDGLSGISLFFGYLGKLTSCNRYLEISRKSIQSGIAFISPLLSNATLAKELPLGAFTGLGSLIYALDHLHHVVSTKYIEDQCSILIEEALSRVATDGLVDIMGGSAGLGAALSGLRCGMRDRVLRCAEACGSHLQDCARREGDHVSWPLAWRGHTGLTGYAHGAAGIEIALLRLSELSGNTHLRDLAESAIRGDRLALEASKESRSRENHVVTGGPDGDDSVDAKWCHGAVGVGMARVEAAKYLGLDRVAGEVEACLAICRDHQIHDSDCICHGLFGVSDFFIEVAREFKRPELLADARAIVSKRMAHREEWPWRSATPGYVTTPGLMTGLAGIGYGLLRVFAPDVVPSILNLSPGGGVQ
jgi:type 2 lantibiotic biosynthesis protein LanM